MLDGWFLAPDKERSFLDSPATALGRQSVLESRQIPLPGPTFNARTSQQLSVSCRVPHGGFGKPCLVVCVCVGTGTTNSAAPGVLMECEGGMGTKSLHVLASSLSQALARGN